MPIKPSTYTQKVDYLPDYFDVDDGNREVPVNMTLSAEGFLQKDYGIDDFLSSFTFPAQPTWVKTFKKKDGTTYSLVASGTKVYNVNLTKLRAYPLGTAIVAKTGTVAVTVGTVNIVGTGTTFVADFAIGDTIIIGTETCTVATIGGNLAMTVDTGVTTATSSGLTISKVTEAVFTAGGYFGSVEYNNDLYFGNAVNDFCKFDGSIITAYGSNPKGNIFEVFEDRVFVSGVTAEPLNVYYSDVATPTTFSAPSVLKPLGTDKVTGCVNYYGSLVILKLNSLWKMTFVYDQVAAAFLPKLELLNRNYGCIGFRAYSWVENDIWFFTGLEVRAIGFKDQQTGVLGVDPSVISNDIKETLKLVSATEASKTVMFYDNRKLYLSVPLSTYNDTMFVSHLLYKNAWCKIKSRKKANVCSIDSRDGVVYFASSNESKMYRWNSTYLDIATAISAYVIFKEYSDKDFSQTNIWRYIDIKFKNLQAQVAFNVWTDNFDLRTSATKTAFVGTDAEGQENSLGEIPVGENLVADAFGEDVTSANFVKRRISLLKKGTTVQFGLASSIASESFTICAFEITALRKPRRYYSVSKIISI